MPSCHHLQCLLTQGVKRMARVWLRHLQQRFAIEEHTLQWADWAGSKGLSPQEKPSRRSAAVSTLVIVESPNKVKSIEGYLGDGYVVDSSVGHIRDLPRNADEVPAEYKGQKGAPLGVNREEGLEPIYVVSAEKKQQMAKLKKLLKNADELVLATDEDREGEAIAWHLFDELKPKVPVKRIVFNEITKDAIQYAIAHPRDIDMDLVDAQEARRILDRLYGYEVSPVL